MTCELCDEAIPPGADTVPLGTVDGPGWAHRECMLRQAVGGIGHLVAHDYWCRQHHDPDAGLTFRQSSLLADCFIHVVGIDRPAESPL